MKTVYEAAHGLEAHMIADLLRQQSIVARVEGEYLAGAIGELPAAGLVRVVVDEDDYAPARRVIEGWFAEQPAEDPADARMPRLASRARWPYVAAGLVLGIALSHAGQIVQALFTTAEVETCRT
ncbi:DUF2007 domain-containing protein [Ramlibacter sp.]|uniref:putative signal transducing protein n=1 Tax=Ramlibacter sp. TaxID=1917967 RepID=UPI003D13C588